LSQSRFLLAVVFGLALLARAGGQDAAPGGVKATKAPPRVKASQSATLRDYVGQRVTVWGHVSRTGRSNSGHEFLNFDGSDVSAFIHKDDVAKFSRGGPAKQFENKTLEVTGLLEVFERRLQIRVREPSQIREVSAIAATSPEPLPEVKLKKLGADAWLSPAGLRYQGRDPQGLTRLEHVLRHAEDEPDRDGPHGVFDGGENGALAVIDEAWRRIQQQNIKPQREQNRDLYTVSLGRKIGYLGGREGARRRNPPLTRVFLVVEQGTTNLVTAFPK
jgi:hypothetical protein